MVLVAPLTLALLQRLCSSVLSYPPDDAICFILSFTRFHLAAIPVHPLYGDPAPQVLLQPAVEGDALSDVVDHREELEEGSER